MRALPSLHRPIQLALTALVPIVVGCGDSGTEPPDELVGTWNATAIVVEDHDFTDDGMTLTYTLRANGEYSYTVTNDQFDYCDPGPSCSDSGDYAVEGNQITFDPDTVWEETYTYSLVATTLTISSTFGAVTFTLTFEKQ
ncbi:MAG: hypothetical protein AMS20_02580 [Gemmatimonas sp. SG8_28]|jgi:hypothetical protein|nr:MAG: hypothetical protein AMS20_02580 [Gemmatimonas sp. SG8_28]